MERSDPMFLSITATDGSRISVSLLVPVSEDLLVPAWEAFPPDEPEPAPKPEPEPPSFGIYTLF